MIQLKKRKSDNKLENRRKRPKSKKELNKKPKKFSQVWISLETSLMNQPLKKISSLKLNLHKVKKINDLNNVSLFTYFFHFNMTHNLPDYFVDHLSYFKEFYSKFLFKFV